MKYLKTCIILTCMIMSVHARAHSPTEIGFKFLSENGKVYLEVHLTSITLFDLLADRNAELKGAKTLKLNKYLSDYTAYFNDRLTISFDDITKNDLTYVSSHLSGHDTHLKFLVEGAEPSINSYAFEVNAFDFYSQPKFTVIYDLPDTHELYKLTKTNNRCYGVASNIEVIQQEASSQMWLILLLPVIGIVTWLMRKKNINEAHPI